MSGQLPSFARKLVLAAQASLPNVTLVGGAGLAMILGHRTSRDLDLFCSAAEDLSLVVAQLEAAVVEHDASLTSVRTAPTFRRFDVTARDELVRIDIALDKSPLLDPHRPLVDGVRVLSLRDQRANKIGALLGRSELRDLIDLFVLDRNGWPLLEGLDDAQAKDAGIDLAWLAWALRQIRIAPLPGLLIDLDDQELDAFRNRVADTLLDRAGALERE